MRAHTMAFALFGVVLIAAPAGAPPPAVVCRDCHELREQLRAAQRVEQLLREQVEKAKQSRARLEVTLQAGGPGCKDVLNVQGARQ